MYELLLCPEFRTPIALCNDIHVITVFQEAFIEMCMLPIVFVCYVLAWSIKVIYAPRITHILHVCYVYQAWFVHNNIMR